MDPGTEASRAAIAAERRRSIRFVAWFRFLGISIAFALNGTFAWLAHAPVNPVAFLPALLLGVELAFAATVAARRGGWWLIAVAEAGMFYAGFPEVAFIGGLLGVCWFAWRCGCLGRGRLHVFARKAASSRARTTVVPIAKTGRRAASAALIRSAVSPGISYDSECITWASSVSLWTG